MIFFPILSEMLGGADGAVGVATRAGVWGMAADGECGDVKWFPDTAAQSQCFVEKTKNNVNPSPT